MEDTGFFKTILMINKHKNDLILLKCYDILIIMSLKILKLQFY